MNHSNPHQAGMTLLEVLISAVIISAVFLWISDMHTKGLKTASDTNQRTQAIWLAEDMLERVKAAFCHANSYIAEVNRANSGSYCSTLQNCVGAVCNTAEMTQYNVQQVFCNSDQINDFAMSLRCVRPTTNAVVASCEHNDRIEATVSWLASGGLGGVATERQQANIDTLLHFGDTARFASTPNATVQGGNAITNTLPANNLDTNALCRGVVVATVHIRDVDLYAAPTVTLTSPGGDNFTLTWPLAQSSTSQTFNLGSAAVIGDWTLTVNNGSSNSLTLEQWHLDFQ